MLTEFLGQVESRPGLSTMPIIVQPDSPARVSTPTLQEKKDDGNTRMTVNPCLFCSMLTFVLLSHPTHGEYLHLSIQTQQTQTDQAGGSCSPDRKAVK